VLVAALIVALLTAVGFVLCILPGIVVAFFTMFVTALVVGEGASATDAISGSVALVRQNLGAVVVWFLLAIVLAFVGAIVCLVGLLVTVPVIVISQAYTVRVLHGRPVAAPVG
jgi:uncharacterized membrane protein